MQFFNAIILIFCFQLIFQSLFLRSELRIVFAVMVIMMILILLLIIAVTETSKLAALYLKLKLQQHIPNIPRKSTK